MVEHTCWQLKTAVEHRSGGVLMVAMLLVVVLVVALLAEEAEWVGTQDTLAKCQADWDLLCLAGSGRAR